MRYGIIIGIIVGMLGCGDVEPIGDGSAGSGGTTGMGGSGGTDCVPDSCNTCVNGVKTPVTDGTSCGASWCGGSAVSPFGGTYATTVLASACQAGACVDTQITCQAAACNCGSVGVAYAGCFTDTGPAICKCVNAQGSYCGG